MKKLLALALAVVMMMAIALPVFAAADTDPIQSDRVGNGNDDSAADNYLVDGADKWEDNDVLIKYGVAQAYTVTIPEAITLHEYTGETTATQTKGYVYSLQNVKIEDVVIAPTEEINIYLKSNQTATYGSAGSTQWFLWDVSENNDKNRVTYAVSTDAFMPGEISGLANGGKILTCAVARGNVGTQGSEAETNLYFSSKGTAQEGTYTDTLTFTVMVEKVVVAPADPDAQG